MLTENDVVRITGRIARHSAPLVVGVFGSYATGAARDRSDLDLFVIKHRAGQQDARRQAIRRLLFVVLHPVDVQVFTPEEFESTVYERLSFAWVIAGQARLYHWTEEATSLVPSLFVGKRPAEHDWQRGS
jgi:predicted nucleotidyltransferase